MSPVRVGRLVQLHGDPFTHCLVIVQGANLGPLGYAFLLLEFPDNSVCVCVYVEKPRT